MKFQVSTDEFKKAVQLAKAVLYKSGTTNISVVLGTSTVRLVCVSGGSKLVQTLAAQTDMEGMFSLPVDLFAKLKYPGKSVELEFFANAVRFKSGSFIGKLALPVSRALTEESLLEDVPLTHVFDRDMLVTGLHLVSFDPILSSIKRRIVYMKNDQAELVLKTSDSHRGAKFKAVMPTTSAFELTLDLTPLMTVLGAGTFKKEKKSKKEEPKQIELGTTGKYVKVKCDTLEYQFPKLTGSVRDVDTLLAKLQAPVCAFCVDSRAFAGAIEAVCCVNKEKDKDIKICFKLKPAEAKKSNKAEIIVSINTKTANTAYSVPVDKAVVHSEDTIWTTYKMVKDLLNVDGLLELTFYDKLFIVKSLAYDLQFFLPRVKNIEN